MRYVVTTLRIGLILAAIIVAASWMYAVAIRIRDPYPLDWLEGVVVVHALRWGAGLPIYAPPAADFIPTLYPPLGYWVLGTAMKLFGAGLPVARATSALATISLVVLMGTAIHRRTRSLVAGVAAGGAFLAGYVACGSWYDLARIDMLFLLFAFASLFLASRRADGPLTVMAAGCAALAFLTRQHGLLIILVGFLHFARAHRREAIRFLVVVALLVVPAVVMVNSTTEGWFLRFVWSGLPALPMHLDRAPRVLGRVITTFAIPMTLFAIWFGMEVRRRGGVQALLSIWTLSLLAFGMSAILGMLREGGDINHFIPALMLALLTGGFALGDLERERDARPFQAVGVLGLFCLMFLVWPPPSRAIPPAALIRAQEQVVAELGAIEGDVFVLEDPYYLWLAGKPTNADGASIFVLSYQGLQLPSDLESRIAGEQYAAVVLSEPAELGTRARTASARRVYALIHDHYQLVREIRAEDPEVNRLRIPRYFYRPRGMCLVDPLGGR